MSFMKSCSQTGVLKIAILISFSITIVESDKILYITPISSLSESIFYHSIVKELHSRGHEITYVTASQMSTDDTSHTLKQIVSVSPVEITQLFSMENSDFVKQRKLSKEGLFLLTYSDDVIVQGCHKTFQNEKFFKEVLNKSAGDFDLLIFPQNVHTCFYGLVHKFQAPFIFTDTIPLFPWQATIFGSWQTPSFVPTHCLGFSDRMNFIERFTNAVLSMLIGAVDLLVSQPKYTEIYRQYLGQDFPPSWKIEKHASLALTNSHFAVNYPRPSIYPSIIEVGGFHCRPPKPLPKDMEHFVSGSHHGFIYFSFGTVANPSYIPKHIVQAFVKVFSTLKQRVLWKMDKNYIDSDLPENIMISKWFPQQDILGHPKIKCFITQGGIFSMQESIYHGVPVIGIPIIADQDTNINQLVDKGSAVFLELLDLNEETLGNALKTILTNTSYSVQAKKLSASFRDVSESPQSRGIFWIEYVMRHKGAQHLFSPARELTFFQYFSLDVITVILLIFLFLSIIVYICIRRIVKYLSSVLYKGDKLTKKTN